MGKQKKLQTKTKDRHGRAKLTQAEVDEIRALYAPRPTLRELAERYNVAISTVSYVLKRGWNESA